MAVGTILEDGVVVVEGVVLAGGWVVEVITLLGGGLVLAAGELLVGVPVQLLKSDRIRRLNVSTRPIFNDLFQ